MAKCLPLHARLALALGKTLCEFKNAHEDRPDLVDAVTEFCRRLNSRWALELSRRTGGR
jgi:hypothetical protein